MSLRSSAAAANIVFYRRLGRSPLAAAHGSSPAVLQSFPGSWRETTTVNYNYPPIIGIARPSNITIRTYYYFPTTWSEVQERFERWIEQDAEHHRFVKVQLLSRRPRNKNDEPPQRQYYLISRFVGRTHATWNSFYQKNIARQQQVVTKNNHSIAIQQQHSPSGVEMPPLSSMRSRYLGWKTRRKEQYHGWKARRSEQIQGWKARRQEQYQGWKQRRRQEWKNIIQQNNIIVREYSKPEWFDDLGRPVTSKDSLGRFVNPWQSQSTNGLHSPFTILRWRWERAVRFAKKKILPILSRSPAIQPPPPRSRSRLSSTSIIDPSNPLPIPSPQSNDHEIACTWIGHSTCYIQMNGFSMLFDPIFSTKSSPYQEEWIPIGVSREVPPSHSIDHLVHHAGGTIDVCFISHDHYDHMDLHSVLKLAPYVEKWVVPLGIGKWLTKKAGIQSHKIVELKWWQQVGFTKKSTRTPTTTPRLSTKLFTGDSSSGEEYHHENENFDISVTCCPASHWSSRTMFDRNHRLWGSFAVTSPTQRLFLCGDTGLPETFPLFRQIGDALGPFDLACIPIGAYEPDHYNKMAHMNPEEALQAHQEIMSKHSLGIHWGTFALGDEPLDEPPLKLQEALEKKEASANVAPFVTVAHGMTIIVNHQKQVLPVKENELMIYENSMMQYQDKGLAATTRH